MMYDSPVNNKRSQSLIDLRDEEESAVSSCVEKISKRYCRTFNGKF